MDLRAKYNHAIQTAKGFGMQGQAEERDGKLHFVGAVTEPALAASPRWAGGCSIRSPSTANPRSGPSAWERGSL